MYTPSIELKLCRIGKFCVLAAMCGFLDKITTHQQLRDLSACFAAPSRTDLLLFPRSMFPSQKEHSLPNNWPNPSLDDLQTKPNRLISIGSGEQEYLFRNNFVKTSKYEWYNFFPKFLMEEFNPNYKIANCYFLLVSALQCVPPISNTQGYPTVLIPLLFVILADGIFAVLEDYSRHKADTEANSSICDVYSHETREFLPTKWAEIHVGDFVLVKSRGSIPADLVILGVAEKTKIPQGLCYVETKSLDGETNLKIRNAVPNTLAVVRFSPLPPSFISLSFYSHLIT
jgi:magnesium-transporting ATPase (P-type)